MSYEMEEVETDVIIKPRLIACQMGETKTSKTLFGLTGPGDISVIDVDDGIHRPWTEFRKRYPKKKVNVVRYRQGYMQARYHNGSEQATMKIASDLLDRMHIHYHKALQVSRTVIVDGFYEVYELARLAEFGKTEQVKGIFYGPVNREMKWWMDMARDSDANVLFTHALRDEYGKDGKQTGGRKIEGWEKIYGQSDIILRHYLAPGQPIPDRYCLRVEHSGVNPQYDGETFSNIDLPTLGQMIFPNSQCSNWE